MKNQKEKNIVIGTVTEALPSTMFRVEIEGGKVLLCHLAGKMRIHHIKVMPGDNVRIELNDYDEDKGRIVYRE